MVEDVALQVRPRRLLDERQAALAQLEDRALGHVKDRLAREGCLLAGEGDLLDVADELAHFPFGRDPAAAVREPDVEASRREGAREHHVLGGGCDVDEAAAARHAAVELRDVDVPAGVRLRRAEDRQVEAAAVVIVELLVHADLGERVVGVAEVLVVRGGSADGAGLGGQQRVVGDAFLGEHDPDVGRHTHPEVHGLARPDLHGGAARHDLANGQRQRLDVRDGDLDLPRKGGIVLGVFGLHVIVGLGDHDVVDEVSGDAHEVRVESARRDHRLRLGDHDPAGIVDGLGDGKDLHLQALVLHRQVAHLVGVRAADEPDVDREPAIVQVLLAVQLDERDEVLRGDVVDLGALDARIDEGAQPDFGDDAGPMGGDLAVERRHDALRQVVAFEFVVGGEPAQGGGGGHDPADPPLDQPLVGELAQAFALAARADGGGVDDRQAARALPGQPSLLEGGDDFLVDAGQTEAGERDRVAVLDERGGLRRADCLGHPSLLWSFGVERAAARIRVGIA